MAGWLTDWYSNRKKQQRNHKPEDRLVPLIVIGIVGPVSILWFGATLAHGTSWVSAAFAFVFLSMPIAGSPSIIIAYCSDCFVFYSGDIQVMIMTAKNLFAFGIIFYGVDWFLGQGLMKASGELAGIYLFCYMMFIPIYYFGPKIRAKSKRWLE